MGLLRSRPSYICNHCDPEILIFYEGDMFENYRNHCTKKHPEIEASKIEVEIDNGRVFHRWLTEATDSLLAGKIREGLVPVRKMEAALGL